MFSPGGKRQVLLTIKRAKEQGLDPTPVLSKGKKTYTHSSPSPISPTMPPSSPPKTLSGVGGVAAITDGVDPSFDNGEDKIDSGVGNFCSKKALTRMLDNEEYGVVMRKLMSSTVR